MYYAGGHGEKAQVVKTDPKTLEKTFAKYKDAGSGKIEVEGIMKFYSELGVDAQADTITLLISYYMGAQTMGEYTWDEFKFGFNKLGVSTT